MKLPLQESFASLCSYISLLRQGLTLLAEGKQETIKAVLFTIPTSGWGSDSSVPNHPNYLDINVTGLTASDIVDVDVAPCSTAVARAADFTTVQTYADKFRLHARNIPTVEIEAQYTITRIEHDETEE